MHFASFRANMFSVDLIGANIMDEDQINSGQSDLEGVGNMDAQLPNPAISTMVPALVVGYIYGSKREHYFPRQFRIKVIAIWIAISLVFTALLFYFIGLGLVKRSVWMQQKRSESNLIYNSTKNARFKKTS